MDSEITPKRIAINGSPKNTWRRKLANLSKAAAEGEEVAEVAEVDVGAEILAHKQPTSLMLILTALSMPPLTMLFSVVSRFAIKQQSMDA